MTVLATWVRKVRNCEELLFASDSRLSGNGATFDCCAKIMNLPRSDCAISFGGDTDNAYPLMNQLVLAINAHRPLQRRSVDITEVVSHALKIFNGIAHSIQTEIEFLKTPNVSFIFGGYSWIYKRFELWKIIYNRQANEFRAYKPEATWMDTRRLGFYRASKPKNPDSIEIGKVVFGGNLQTEAKLRFFDLIRERYSLADKKLTSWALNMEPFEVVRDMLRDSHDYSIGGAPQLVKVYQYMDSTPLAVYWPQKDSGQVVLQGRPLLGYENIDHWTLDPDTLLTEHSKHSRKD